MEKPKIGNIVTLESVARELFPFFTKKHIPLNFKGLTKTYDTYSHMRVEDLFGLNQLVYEFDLWQGYLEEVAITAKSFRNDLECSVDYLESLKGNSLYKYTSLIAEKKKQIKNLEKFENELLCHTKTLMNCSNYCKALFNKQIYIYQKGR